MANTITGCRVLGSIAMLLFPACSTPFYIFYLFCGFSDMVDGTVARKTNSISEFGARFDTGADVVFAAVSLIKLLPVFQVPGWLWIWIAVIATIKIGNIVWGYAVQNRLVSLHTVTNKAAGLLLFLLPLTVSFAEWKYTSVAVCSVATLAAIQEGVSIAKSNFSGR
ncbi:MAG: CDP-alcohol phosphatidyltransferase family protein [Clostridia bacterium]|nr:CDP-alcohol phosphatidyltransferase family protein [Clostridia bacterium]